MTTSLELGPPVQDAAAVVILAHGRGGSPEDMAELARRLDRPDIHFSLLRAPDNSWYPNRFMAPLADNEPFLTRALSQYAAAIDSALAGGARASRLVLGGFSQGACLTAGLLWHRPAAYGAAMLFTGGMIGPPGTHWPLQPKLRNMPVLLTCGDQDDWIPLPRVEETDMVLSACGARVAKHIYRGRPHLICDDEIALAQGLLDAVAAA